MIMLTSRPLVRYSTDYTEFGDTILVDAQEADVDKIDADYEIDKIDEDYVEEDDVGGKKSAECYLDNNIAEEDKIKEDEKIAGDENDKETAGGVNPATKSFDFFNLTVLDPHLSGLDASTSELRFQEEMDEAFSTSLHIVNDPFATKSKVKGLRLRGGVHYYYKLRIQ